MYSEFVQNDTRYNILLIIVACHCQLSSSLANKLRSFVLSGNIIYSVVDCEHTKSRNRCIVAWHARRIIQEVDLLLLLLFISLKIYKYNDTCA